jgi:hypothetical protein
MPNARGAAHRNFYAVETVQHGVYRRSTDGATAFVEVLEFMQRLAALVPRPHLHLIRLVSA